MYGVKFPLTSKQKVIGPDAHALYQWIAGEAGEGAAPKWNFHKYLIGKDGSLKGAWPSRVRPGLQRDHRRDREGALANCRPQPVSRRGYRVAVRALVNYFSASRTLSNTSWNISVVSRPVFVL